MPQIRPITDLRNTTEISEICHAKQEPVFITKNGYGDLVIMSIETYEAMTETAAADAAEKRSLLCGGSILDNYSVKLLSRALRDLDGIYAYIAKTLQEPETALRMVEELEAQILSLETMPYRCAERRTGAYAGKDYRQLFVKNYTVIFRIDEKEKQVIIVTVRYSRSQF